MCTFVPNKSIGELINVSPTNHVYSETFPSESPFIDQNFVLLEIEDNKFDFGY